jgi:prepilin-type N-terminal cleavage/methylation domain-containing protein
MSRRLREHLRAAAADDRGFTMTEIVVTMTVMSVVMAIFTGGIVQLFNTSNKSESLAASQMQNNIAFLRLDKQIRYASGISTPGTVSSAPYVEYLLPGAGTATCYELRLKDAKLQQRSWIQGTTVTNGMWTVIASGVTSTQPFTFRAANETFNFQRLRLQLTATYGGNKTLSVANTDITFTALNTTLVTSSASVCAEGRTT